MWTAIAAESTSTWGIKGTGELWRTGSSCGRHAGKIPVPCEKAWDYPLHFTRWTPQGFVEMCRHLDLNVLDVQESDDKVGNGFAVVIKLD